MKCNRSPWICFQSWKLIFSSHFCKFSNTQCYFHCFFLSVADNLGFSNCSNNLEALLCKNTFLYYKSSLWIVKCITKGRELVPHTLLGLFSWQKITTGSFVRHGKKTYLPDTGNTVKAALAGQIGTGFSALFPAGAGLLTSRLSLLQGSQPLKCFICKPLSSPQHRKAPQMLLIGTAGTENIACPRCLPTHLLQLCSQKFWGISEICTLRIRLLSCLTQKSSWNVAASCLNSFSEVRFSSFYAKAAYNKEEKTAEFRKALFW